MKKSIRFKTRKGNTGEIRFDSDSPDFAEYNAVVIYDDGSEFVGDVYNSNADDIVHVVLKNPVEIDGKTHAVMSLLDKNAKSEYRKIRKEIYKEQRFKRQNTITEEDKENLAAPLYYYYDSSTYEDNMVKIDPEKKICAMARKYIISHNVTELVSMYYVVEKFKNSDNLREKAEKHGTLTDKGYKKIEISDDEVEAVVEEYFEEFFAEIKEEEDRRQELINKAKETGVPQVLYRVFAECNDPEEQCDLDVITTYIDGEGNTEVHRQHTW